MNLSRYFLVLVLLIVLGFAVYFSTHSSESPVAKVNGHVISRSDFNKEYQAMYNYSYAAVRTYGDAKQLAQFNSKENSDALKVGALEQLIDSVLIHDEVAHRLGANVDTIVAGRVDAASTTTDDFKNAAAAIWGISFGEVRSRFLIPMAESEFLREQLGETSSTATNDPIDKWLATAKQEANVTILDSGFAWSQNGVGLK